MKISKATAPQKIMNVEILNATLAVIPNDTAFTDLCLNRTFNLL